MANKGLMNLWRKVTGGKEKPIDEKIDESIKEQQKLTEDRVRELDLAQLLTEVELSLDKKTNKLSQEQIEKLGIRSVLKRARFELVENPVVTDQDMTEIDGCIKYIIYEVGRAVEMGYETAAHWSNIALAAATETLHIPIKGNDLEYAAQLMESKRKYARNLKLMTQNALSYDIYTTELNDKSDRYRNKEQELLDLTKETQDILDSKEGRILLANIRDCADDLAKLKPAARDLRNKLRDMHLKESKLLAYALDINTAAENQTMYAHHLDQSRNMVANYPRVEDPKLAAKNQEAAEEYADELRKRLNRAEAGMKAIAANLSELLSMGKHPLFAQGTTQALDMAAELQLRPLREKEAELKAAKEAIRDKEHASLLKRVEQELNEQLNLLVEEEKKAILAEQMEKDKEKEKEAEHEVEEETEAEEELDEEEEEDLILETI